MSVEADSQRRLVLVPLIVVVVVVVVVLLVVTIVGGGGGGGGAIRRCWSSFGPCTDEIITIACAPFQRREERSLFLCRMWTPRWCPATPVHGFYTGILAGLAHTGNSDEDREEWKVDFISTILAK